MIVSVPAPPPSDARPPPCPAWSSTAAARISASRMRMLTRTVYMRGARYLGCGGPHKIGPCLRIERRAADEQSVDLGLGEALCGALQVDAAPVQNPDDGRGALLEPGANDPVHVGRILRRGVAARPDRPDRLRRGWGAGSPPAPPPRRRAPAGCG